METRLTACFKQCLLRGHFVPQQQHFFTSVYYFLAPGNCILTLKIWSCDKQMSVVQNFSSKRRLFTATGSLQVSFAYWLVVVKICQSLCLQQRQQQDDFVSEMMMVALPRKFIKSKDDL
ncbi:conserved hypothetical protein [Trichinella spiralis]|uniref:hypothetical protein n=1 Tax=Trichinella spiralis TaxID=6334 RepID=UPI0001EFB354|nr:conserved hypothetical protein [Trichinella spiralis]